MPRISPPRINLRFLPSKSDLSASIYQKITHHWVTTWQQQPPSNKLFQIKHLPFPCPSANQDSSADGTKYYSLASESVILDSPMHIFSLNSHPFHVITAAWIIPSPLNTSLNAHPLPLLGPDSTSRTP